MPPQDEDWLVNTYNILADPLGPPTWDWFIRGVWPGYICKSDGKTHSYLSAGEISQDEFKYWVLECKECSFRTYRTQDATDRVYN